MGSARLLSLARNEAGRDFVVGDVHGCFSELEQLLAQAGFDPARDRLLSVGDLVDRGPESARVLEWLERRWLYAVRGNHEQMALDWTADDVDGAARYRLNGGGWFIDLPEYERVHYRRAFAALPLALQVDTPQGVVGLVHADCPDDDWGLLRARLQQDDVPDENGDTLLSRLTWCRQRARGVPRQPVAGVSLLCVGHTPQGEVRQIDNVCYLDTGGVYGQRLSMLDLASRRVYAVGVGDKGYAL